MSKTTKQEILKTVYRIIGNRSKNLTEVKTIFTNEAKRYKSLKDNVNQKKATKLVDNVTFSIVELERLRNSIKKEFQSKRKKTQ